MLKQTLFLHRNLVHTEGHSKVVGGEGGHWLTIVRLDNSSKSWNGSWADLFTEESKDTDLGKTSVVDFGNKTLVLLFLAHVLAELERIVEVERNWVRDALSVSTGEVRVVTWLSAGHVVLVVIGGKFTPELKEGNGREDLPLGVFADGIPQGRRVGVVREGTSVHFHGPWEFDSVGVDNVSNEGEHSNTSMPS